MTAYAIRMASGFEWLMLADFSRPSNNMAGHFPGMAEAVSTPYSADCAGLCPWAAATMIWDHFCEYPVEHADKVIAIDGEAINEASTIAEHTEGSATTKGQIDD